MRHKNDWTIFELIRMLKITEARHYDDYSAMHDLVIMRFSVQKCPDKTIKMLMLMMMIIMTTAPHYPIHEQCAKIHSSFDFCCCRLPSFSLSFLLCAFFYYYFRPEFVLYYFSSVTFRKIYIKNFWGLSSTMIFPRWFMIVIIITMFEYIFEYARHLDRP